MQNNPAVFFIIDYIYPLFKSIYIIYSKFHKTPLRLSDKAINVYNTMISELENCIKTFKMHVHVICQSLRRNCMFTKLLVFICKSKW